MSDNEEQEFTVEKKISTKQARTPAQLEALRQARLTRSLKAKIRRETPESINLMPLVGMVALSGIGLSVYYYMNRQQNVPELPINLPQPIPVLVNTPKPITPIVNVITQTIKKQIEKIIVPEPIVVPEPVPEPVVDTRMGDFMKDARVL